MKNLFVSRPRKTTVSFGRFYGVDLRTDGESGGFNRASESYNFSTVDGALKISVGGVKISSDFILPSATLLSVYFYKKNDYETGIVDDRVMIFCDDGFIYSCPITGGEFKLIPTLHFYNRPIGLCYNYNSKDVIIFSSDEGYIRIYDGSTTVTRYNMPTITSMCMHAERLFLTTGGVNGALWFSDDFDPTNWNVSLSEAGFIDMSDERGEMICAVDFANYVYVFRSYGIARVSAYADQTQFSVTQLLTSCGKIVKNSIVKCGDCLTFVASDGIYRFDGYSASKISQVFDKKFDYSEIDVKGVYYNGYVYYIFKNLKTGEKTVLKITPSGNDYVFIKAGDIVDFSVINAENKYLLWGIDNETNQIFEVREIGSFLDVNTEKFWKSKKTDFGITAPKKLLKELSFYTTEKCEVKVGADGNEKTFDVQGKGKIIIRPNLKGNIFDFSIKSNQKEIEVSGLTITLSYYL